MANAHSAIARGQSDVIDRATRLQYAWSGPHASRTPQRARVPRPRESL